MGSGGNLPIGPGIWGFIAFFVLAISLWLLVRNMNARLRRMAYRDRELVDADALSTPDEGQPEQTEPTADDQKATDDGDMGQNDGGKDDGGKDDGPRA